MRGIIVPLDANAGSARLRFTPEAVMRAIPARTHAPETALACMTAVAFDEMPDYPDVLVSAVEQAIAELPHSKLWFTYRDIKDHFGVSRATVARRLRERLVPGVRMQGSHVLEDGAVRRFDRTQLRWLLLAVRYRALLRNRVRMPERNVRSTKLSFDH